MQKSRRSLISLIPSCHVTRAQGYAALFVQHEYGIFGGVDGAFLAPLLKGTNAALILTLHTVLQAGPPVDGGAGHALIAAAAAHVVLSPGGCVTSRAWSDAAAAWPEVGDIADASASASASGRKRHSASPPPRRAAGAGALASAAPPALPPRPRGACAYIPHGVPTLPSCDALDRAAAQAALLPRAAALTLLVGGLLGPGKGIETVIAAMPIILAAMPSAVLLVAGAPHPGLPSPAGYLRSLAAAAAHVGARHAVHFLPGYLSDDDLHALYGAADVFICAHTGAEQASPACDALFVRPLVPELTLSPALFLPPEQISSGTMVMALAAGAAVIATPFAQAAELLAGGAGLLVPFDDPPAIAAAVLRLADGPTRARFAAAGVAAVAGRAWPAVGAAYAALAAEAAAAAAAAANGNLSSSSSMFGGGAADVARGAGAVGVANAGSGAVALQRRGFGGSSGSGAAAAAFLLHPSGHHHRIGWAASETWLLRDDAAAPRGMAPPHALLLQAAHVSCRQRRWAGGRGPHATRVARALDDDATSSRVTRLAAAAPHGAALLLQDWAGPLARERGRLRAVVRRRITVPVSSAQSAHSASASGRFFLELHARLEGPALRAGAAAWLTSGLDQLDVGGSVGVAAWRTLRTEGPLGDALIERPCEGGGGGGGGGGPSSAAAALQHGDAEEAPPPRAVVAAALLGEDAGGRRCSVTLRAARPDADAAFDDAGNATASASASSLTAAAPFFRVSVACGAAGAIHSLSLEVPMAAAAAHAAAHARVVARAPREATLALAVTWTCEAARGEADEEEEAAAFAADAAAAVAARAATTGAA
jgi:glycosyltransferase involved in cell wall biosynthesis